MHFNKPYLQCIITLIIYRWSVIEDKMSCNDAIQLWLCEMWIIIIQHISTYLNWLSGSLKWITRQISIVYTWSRLQWRLIHTAHNWYFSSISAIFLILVLMYWICVFHFLYFVFICCFYLLWGSLTGQFPHKVHCHFI